MKRHEVVDRRRAHAGPLGRIHPVREVEDVEPAQEPLERQATELAPGHPEGVSGRQRHELLLDVDRFERLPHPRRPAQPRWRERDDLVVSRGTRTSTGAEWPGDTPCGSITRSSSTRSPATPVVYGPTVTTPVG